MIQNNKRDGNRTIFFDFNLNQVMINMDRWKIISYIFSKIFNYHELIQTTNRVTRKFNNLTALEIFKVLSRSTINLQK
jgi:hypothetical protein